MPIRWGLLVACAAVAAPIAASPILAMGAAMASGVASAQGLDPGPESLETLHHTAASSPAVRLDRVIIKLSPEAGRQAHLALLEGFAAGLSNPQAQPLDELLKRARVGPLK